MRRLFIRGRNRIPPSSTGRAGEMKMTTWDCVNCSFLVRFGSWMLPNKKNPFLFSSYPPLLYSPDPRIKGGVRPSVRRTSASLSGSTHSIAAGVARTAAPASFPPTLGLISHGCSFNNPFLPPQRAPQGRTTESANRPALPSLVRMETGGSPVRKPCP